MAYRINRNTEIVIGHEGEKGFRTIEFDVSMFPEEGTVYLDYMRYGDTRPYPINLERKGNKAYWTPNEIDTAYKKTGRGQLVCIVGDDVVGKSDVFKVINRFSLDTDTDVPDAYEHWLDRLEQIATGVTEGVESGKQEITDTKDSAVSEVETKRTEAVSEVESKRTEAVESIGTVSGEALSDINTAKTEAVNTVNSAKNDGINRLNDRIESGKAEINTAKTTALDSIESKKEAVHTELDGYVAEHHDALKGEKGDAYIVTEADKQEIADEVEGKYVTELGKVKEDLGVIDDVLKIEIDYGFNRFNIDDVNKYHQINANGQIESHNANSITNFIPCEFGDVIFFSRTWNGATSLSPLTPVWICEFDKNKNFIFRNTQYKTNGTTGYYDVERTNTKYIKAIVPQSILDGYRYSVIVNYDGSDVYKPYVAPFAKSKELDNINSIVKPIINVMSYNCGKWSYGVDGGYSDSVTLIEKLINVRRMFAKEYCDVVGLQEKRNGFDEQNTINANTSILEHWYKYYATRDISVLEWDVPEIRSIYEIENGGYAKTSTNRNYTYGYINFNGKRIFLLNVHLSPNSQSDRSTEINEFLALLQDKEYVIVTGDFNAISGISEFDIWKTNDYKICNGDFFGDFVTAHGDDVLKIDNIIVSSNIDIIDVHIVDEYDKLCSDHLPIVAKLQVN